MIKTVRCSALDVELIVKKSVDKSECYWQLGDGILIWQEFLFYFGIITLHYYFPGSK